MRLPHIHRMENFGTRSLVTHGLMVVTFVGAVLAGLFLDGELGLVSFVALVNFTGGLWVAHSIHSLGHVQGGGEYAGVLAELRDTDDEPTDDPPMADVIDAALTHLVESEQNIQDARDEHPPHVIQSIANTSVLALRYRTRVESRWR